MAGHVIEAHEATVEAGGVDVEMEVIGHEGGGVTASLSITADLDDLDLSEKDVKALHDLTGAVLKTMRASR